MDKARGTGARQFWAEVKGTPLNTFLICLAGVTLSTADQALFSYAIPSITREFSVEVDVIGRILSLSFLVASGVLIFVGILADYWGRKRMFVAMLALSAVFVGLHALADTLGWLALFRTLGFAIAAGIYPITNTMLVEVAPARYRGLAGWLQIGYPLGFAVAALVAAPLIAEYGWRSVFLPAFLVVPLAFVLARLLKETRRFQALEAVGAKAKEKISIKAHLQTLLAPELRGRTICCFIGSFLISLAIGGATFFVPTYLVEDRGLAESTAALLAGGSYTIGVVGYISAAYVGEFVTTRRNALILWVWLGAAAFSATLWLTDTSLQIMLVYGLCVMFLFGSEAIRMPMVSELFPTRIRATATVVTASLAVTTAWWVAPLALTALVEPLGWSMAFTLLGVLPLCLGGAMFLFLSNTASGLEIEDVAGEL